jgi:hypothetical protein
VIFVAVVGVTFWAAARATGGVTRKQRRELPGRLAHCLIPIVVGYIFAHYLSYLVERGQETVVRLADPLGRGWHLLRLESGDVVYFLSMKPALMCGARWPSLAMSTTAPPRPCAAPMPG